MVSDTARRGFVSRLRSWLNGRSAGGSDRRRLRALGWINRIDWINWIARTLRVCPRRRAESTDRAVGTKEHAPGALVGFLGMLAGGVHPGGPEHDDTITGGVSGTSFVMLLTLDPVPLPLLSTLPAARSPNT